MSSINRRGILATGLATVFLFFGSAVFAAQSSQGPALKPKRVGQTKMFMNKDKNGRGKPYIITRTSEELVAFENV